MIILNIVEYVAAFVLENLDGQKLEVSQQVLHAFGFYFTECYAFML